MSIVIVVESLFGNTRAVAGAIADGLREASPDSTVQVAAVTDPVASLADVSLLLLGGPTHAFAMSRERTRQDAVRQGADADPGQGLREWIDRVGPAARDFSGTVVTFDTRVRRFPGSAAASARKALRRSGFPRVERGESFWVTGTPGPLQEGELERAHTWGRSLGSRTAGGRATR